MSTSVPWYFGWRGLGDDHYADIALVTPDGRRFLAHQCVLASRSPVLDNLFKSNLCPEGVLQVPFEASATAVESFLRFLYTNNLTSGHAYTNNLTGVLYLAYYYEVDDLFRVCGAMPTHDVWTSQLSSG